jgi:ferritin-like metal-binding protein YciE
LRTAFEKHLQETERQIDRLEKAFGSLGESPRPKRCEGMRGLIREGSELLRSTPGGSLRDAVMITAAQKVEHYEMASYGTARTYATVLGEPLVAQLLDDTLQEEKNADLKLTKIAEERVNGKAAEEWHRTSARLLEHTAGLAGTAAGIGARTVKRVADAVGLRRHQSDSARATAVELATSSLARARDVAAETAAGVVDMARSRAQRLRRPRRKVSGRRATERTTTRKAAPRKRRTQKSGR